MSRKFVWKKFLSNAAGILEINTTHLNLSYIYSDSPMHPMSVFAIANFTKPYYNDPLTPRAAASTLNLQQLHCFEANSATHVVFANTIYLVPVLEG